MASVTTYEGVTQADFERALEEFENDRSPENEAKVVAIYEKISGFRRTCPDCLAKRAQFQRGLKAISGGDTMKGMGAIASAMRGAVAINLRKIFGASK